MKRKLSPWCKAVKIAMIQKDWGVSNSSIIEEAAKKHRKSGSDHGHWIYPGTTITIPAA